MKDIDSTLTELRAIRRRIDRQAFNAEDWPVAGALFSKEIARCERRQEKMLAKLANEAESEGASGPIIDVDYTVVDDGEADPNERDGSSPDDSDTSASNPEQKRKNHGRNGAGAYVNAKHIFHALLFGVIGSICEACGLGRMSRYREKLIVRIKGQPLFDAEVHHFEQARCKLCGAIVRAEGDATVLIGLGSDYITYDWTACAMLLVMHYFAGAPLKRIDSLHAGWGIPMSDANQWEIANASSDLLFPLYRALERHGIQNGEVLRIDDTGSMIIEVRRQIRAEIAALELLGESTKNVRTGINATGVYLETEQGKVLLFFTGRHHASEIVDQLLEHRRANKKKLVKISDAASKNFSHDHQDVLEEAVCNAHAFLKFRTVKDKHPEEYAIAGEVYKKVFDNDDETQGMSPDERMLYHREHSLPEMKRLKEICKEKLESKLVEPNAPLWEPITFIINQWERLTKFCKVPGVPLDTNAVEQMLIIPVRYLAGSFNYKTQNGADVGDRHMSLIATANANGVEPVAYLTECLRNHEDLAKRPEHYLPWVYRERLKMQSEQGVEHPLRPGTHREHRAAGPSATDDPVNVEASNYATLRQSSGNAQLDGSPPQIRT